MGWIYGSKLLEIEHRPWQIFAVSKVPTKALHEVVVMENNQTSWIKEGGIGY